MILVWNDNKSFSRHLENMRCFRARHGVDTKCGWDIIKDLPALRDVHVPPETGGTRSRLEEAGPMVVPLWKFTLPAGVIN
jgi:hypothetical protein